MPIKLNLGTPLAHWAWIFVFFPGWKTNMPQLLTYLFSSWHRFYSRCTSFTVQRCLSFFVFCLIMTELSKSNWSNRGWRAGKRIHAHVSRKMCKSESQQQKPKLSRPITANYSRIVVFPFRQWGQFWHKSFQQRRSERIMISLLCSGVQWMANSSN